MTSDPLETPHELDEWPEPDEPRRRWGLLAKATAVLVVVCMILAMAGFLLVDSGLIHF